MRMNVVFVVAALILGQGVSNGQTPSGQNLCIHSDAVTAPDGSDGTASWRQLVAMELERAGIVTEAFAGDAAACGAVLRSTLNWKRKTSFWEKAKKVTDRIPTNIPLPIPRGAAGAVATIAGSVASAQQITSMVAGFAGATKPNDVLELSFTLTRGAPVLDSGTLPAVKATEGRLDAAWAELLGSLVRRVAPQVQNGNANRD